MHIIAYFFSQLNLSCNIMPPAGMSFSLFFKSCRWYNFHVNTYKKDGNMKRKLLIIMLMLFSAAAILSGCAGQSGESIDKNGYYYSKTEVAEYIHLYGDLPSNYITKAQARRLGWSGGSVERYKKGAAIGGDRYGNYERKLPRKNYRECDIDTKGKNSRGSKRIIYSSDGDIYYTPDHYETFEQLY